MFFKKNPGFYSSHLDNYIDNIRKDDLSALAWIFCVFAEDSAKHKLKAARVLKEALHDFSLDDIYRVDKQMRETSSMEWSIDWYSLNTNNFITNNMSEEEKFAVLIFSSFNPNGYIREQAVQALASYKGCLPFILLRCNDWVCQVRQAALRLLPTILESAGDKEIINALPLMEKLYRSERCEYHELLSTIVNVFGADRNLIKKGLNSEEIKARRFCLSIISNLAIVDHEYLSNHIKKEPDPFLRKIIFQILLKQNADIEDVSTNFLSDKYPPNRMLALQFLHDNKIDSAATASKNMLMDKNAQVRALARKIFLGNEADFDIRHHYLANLSVKTAVCIYGLGETGRLEDCKLIERFLSDSTPSVVRAAMTAVMRLNPEQYISDITELLAKEHSGIVKTAALLLKKNKGYDSEKVLQICTDLPGGNTKIKCAGLLFLSGKWKSLIYSLMLIGCGCESLDNICYTQIIRWISSYNVSYAVLSDADSRTIKFLLDEKKEFLKPNMVKQIIFLVR